MPKVNKKKAPVVIITGIDQLNALCDAPMIHRFKIGRNVVEVSLRRLTPRESHYVDTIRSGPLPPLKRELDARGREYGEATPRPQDPEYLARKEEAELQAQAMTIWLGWPVLRESKPGLTDKNQICDFVFGRKDDHTSRGCASPMLLSAIYLSIASEEVEAVERANFTTASGWDAN